MRGAKPAQLFTFAAAAIFLLVVLFHSTSVSDNLPGLSDISNGLTGRLSTRPSLKAAMELSEKLWVKTVNQRREIREKFGNFGFFPARNGPTYFTTPYSVWDLVPASYNCPYEVERIGRMGDGGKWVCGMSRYEKNTKPCIVYSFGIQNESSFEQELLERTNCEIWGYDYSVSSFGTNLKPEMAARTHFTQAGIAGTSEPTRNPPFWTIQDLMQQNGHDYIDILKMDIEYAEFNALTSLNAATQDKEFPLGQLFVEIHLFEGNGITEPIFLDWWESLEARGLRPAWTEPNLLAVTIHLEDGLPRLAEYSLINVKDSKNKLYN